MSVLLYMSYIVPWPPEGRETFVSRPNILAKQYWPMSYIIFVWQTFPVLFHPEGTTAGSPVNNVIHYWKIISPEYNGISGRKYYKQNWKNFNPHYSWIGRRTMFSSLQVIQGSYLRIVQWILKKPLGNLSYTLRIIQLDYPEGVPTGPRN
jgi:hypothetical protein